MSTPSTAAPRTIETLKAAIAGRVFVPGEAGYDQGRHAWNVAVDQRPAAADRRRAYLPYVPAVLVTTVIAQRGASRIGAGRC